MPSAAAKIEKQASSEGQDSLKSIVTIFEKKTRNLEKRKGKLDHLKKELEQGKELNEDQKAAVGKYDQVLETLELTRELQKSVTAVVQEHLRQSKRQARREQLERQAREAQRVRELLEVQDVLVALGTPTTRQCFLEGTEGATRLSEEALDRFDQLFQLTCPSREDCATPAAFQANLLQAAEHLVALLDARPRPLLGTTYKALREVLLEVQQSEYFMGAAPEDAASAEAPAAASVSEEDAAPTEEEDPQDQVEQQSPPTEDASPVSEVPELSTESQQQLQQPEVQQVPPMPVVAAVAVPNAVREVEPTPIIPVVPMVAVTTAAPPPLLPGDAVSEAVVAEVVPAGRLDFFQESQIDLESPHMDPAVVAALPSVPPPTLPPPPAAALMQVTTGYVLGHPPPPQHAAALHQPLAPHPVSAPAPPPQQQQPPSLVAAAPPMDFVMEQHMPIPTQTFTNQSLRNNDLDRRPPRRGGGGGGPRHAGGYANGKGSGQQWQSNGSGHDRSEGYRGPPRQAGSGPRGPYQGRGRPSGGRAPPRNAGVPAAAAYAQ